MVSLKLITKYMNNNKNWFSLVAKLNVYYILCYYGYERQLGVWGKPDKGPWLLPWEDSHTDPVFSYPESLTPASISYPSAQQGVPTRV